VIEERKERDQFREFENPRHLFEQEKSWVLFRDFEVPPAWRGTPPHWKRVFTCG
jgi:hypothetical protein